jgi:hypothetical protein
MAMVDMRLGRMREAADHLLRAAAMADSAAAIGAFPEVEAGWALLAIDDAELGPLMTQDAGPVAAAVAEVRVVAHAIAGDSAALSLLDEAESLTACHGCLRNLRIDVLNALGKWPSLIEVGEDVLSRPLNANWSPGTEPLVRLRLARAYLEMGAEGMAAEHLARVAELWRGGDPGVQRLVAGVDRR